MGKFWTLLVRLFGKMADFIKFEADDVNGDVIDNCDQAAQTVSDKEFIDDETQIDDNMEDYYAFINACRSVEHAMQDSFLKSDSRESQHEVNNYCNDIYDPDFEQIDKFRDSAERVEEFERTLLCPHGSENQDSCYYVILYAIHHQLKNK